MNGAGKSSIGGYLLTRAGLTSAWAKPLLEAALSQPASRTRRARLPRGV